MVPSIAMTNTGHEVGSLIKRGEVANHRCDEKLAVHEFKDRTPITPFIPDLIVEPKHYLMQIVGLIITMICS